MTNDEALVLASIDNFAADGTINLGVLGCNPDQVTFADSLIWYSRS